MSTYKFNLSIYLFIYLSIYVSIYLYVYLSRIGDLVDTAILEDNCAKSGNYRAYFKVTLFLSFFPKSIFSSAGFGSGSFDHAWIQLICGFGS